MEENLSTENIATNKDLSIKHVRRSTKRPWFVDPLLVLAVAAASSGGAVIKLMDTALPISKSGWHLQATALLLLPGFVWQWCHQSSIECHQFFQWHTLILLLLVSSFSLACHFALWVWSIDYTSLPHSLLFVSTPPIILAFYACCKRQPLSIGESMGIVLGVLGTVVMAASSQVEKDSEITFAGDLAAFLSAAVFAVHITAGSQLRGWMPLYVYAFPITAGAAIFVGIMGISIEGFQSSSSGRTSGPFSWFKKEFLLPNLFLAIGPGFVGHTGLNAVLRYVSPLIVGMAVMLEPVFGSAIAWAINISPAPRLWTCLGGALLLCGTIWVLIAGERRKRNKSDNMDLLPTSAAQSNNLGTVNQADESSLEKCLLTQTT